MRVLRDPSLSSQQSVVDALMAILRALSLGSVTYLPKVSLGSGLRCDLV